MFKFALITLLTLCFYTVSDAQTAPIGIFEGHGDIGPVLQPGSGTYDDKSKTYTLTGSGENMWFGKDEFYFVWTKVSAQEMTFSANISVLGDGGNDHRKGVLMIRQTLDPGSAYVDIARHGEGLTSIQFREKKNAVTGEIESSVSGPAAVKIEKRGNRFYMWVGPSTDELQFAGGSAWVEMRDPFYVGIGVCSHDKSASASFAFSALDLDTKPKHPKLKGRFSSGKYSTLETVLLSGDARVSMVTPRHLILPSWSADGKTITFEADEIHESMPFAPLRTAAAIGEPLPPQTGQDFSYFVSKADKNTQIWRRSADGSQSVQFTPEDFNNTMPSLSPDGKYLLFLSYSKEYDRLSEGIPVQLRLMLLKDTSIKTLASFVGGPQSLGNHPWSPDGKRIVFASYQTLK